MFIMHERISKKSVLKVVSFFIVVFLASCGNDDKAQSNMMNLQKLAVRHYSELTFQQRLDALLLLAQNDTTKVCYALVMPKRTFIRLSREETYPTTMAKNKTKELYVKSVISNCEYLDSLSKNEESQKDWLIHNSINEPINPIWEQIMEGTKNE